MALIIDLLERIANTLKGESDAIKQQPTLTSLKEISDYLQSTDAHPGVAELATAAEALAGTDAVRIVTPAGLQNSINNLDLLAFAGKNGAGACTLTGIKVGDKVLSVTGVAAGTVGDQSGKFESIITVADQIQQSDAGNLSANIYLALVQRKS